MVYINSKWERSSSFDISIVFSGWLSRLCVSNEPVRSKVATSEEEDMKRKFLPLRVRADAAAGEDDEAADRLSSIDAALVANILFRAVVK